MAKPHYYGLILAGGRGTRFWPRSRAKTPKQLLRFFSARSLIQETVERLRPVIPPSRLWVVSNEILGKQIARDVPEIPRRQILLEPVQRNTAPAIGLACQILHSLDPAAVVGVFPSDHYITRPAPFRRLVRAAFRAADQGKMAVLGIQPRWPETGYGYLEFPPGVQPGSLQPAPLVGFREKPDAATARQFVASGNFFWNAGMFFWRARVFLEALRRHLPKTASLLSSLPPLSSKQFAARLRQAFPRCENISVDYAVMEKVSGAVGVAAGDIGWNDLGSWNAVYELLPRDDRGNVSRSQMLALSAGGNYVDTPGKLTALLGVENLIVVETTDALLVADRSRAQQVGDIVKALEKQNRRDLL